jgi:hypothetical protein
MASKEVWANWRSTSKNKGSDQDILLMMEDVVNTINLLEKMYGSDESSIIVRSLLLEWESLKSVAWARQLYGQYVCP